MNATAITQAAAAKTIAVGGAEYTIEAGDRYFVLHGKRGAAYGVVEQVETGRYVAMPIYGKHLPRALRMASFAVVDGALVSR